MRKAIFKRVNDGFITLKIGGIPTRIGKGDRFVAVFEIVNGMPGIEFEAFGENLTPADDTIQQQGNVFNIVDAPSFDDVKNIKSTYIAPTMGEPLDNPNADKNCPKCHGLGKYHFGGSYGGPTHWSVCECIMFKVEPPPKPAITKGFDPETIKTLKAKSPRDWMIVKKHELKKIMDDAGIDYSQVEDGRMSLYKFLFSIIKDLP